MEFATQLPYSPSQALGERASSSRGRDRANHYIGPALSLGQSQIMLRNWSAFTHVGIYWRNSNWVLLIPVALLTELP